MDFGRAGLRYLVHRGEHHVARHLIGRKRFPAESNHTLAVQRSARKEERAQKTAESKAEKEKLVAEAEKLAEGTDWRNGANRLRDLLATWKELPRLDRATDDEPEAEGAGDAPDGVRVRGPVGALTAAPRDGPGSRRPAW